MQPLARQLGLASLGTLNDRLGDTYAPDWRGCPAAANIPRWSSYAPVQVCPPSVWGRFFGRSIDNHYLAFADPRADGSLYGFQTGIDVLRGSLFDGHTERAGFYVAYGNVDVNVTGLVTNAASTGYLLTRTGKVSLDGWSGGAYWTHVGPSGWYLDAILQFTRYGGTASTEFAHLNTDGTGFISSLEAGYPLSMPWLGPGFVLEPQAQIIWQRVSFEPGNDGIGDVALGDTSGMSGRIGARAKWAIRPDSDQIWEPYVRANLWKDWGSQANTIYSGVDTVALLARSTRLQLGGGLTAKMRANLSFYANADYEFAVGDTDGGRRDGVRGAVGFHYTW